MVGFFYPIKKIIRNWLEKYGLYRRRWHVKNGFSLGVLHISKKDAYSSSSVAGRSWNFWEVFVCVSRYKTRIEKFYIIWYYGMVIFFFSRITSLLHWLLASFVQGEASSAIVKFRPENRNLTLHSKYTWMEKCDLDENIKNLHIVDVM